MSLILRVAVPIAASPPCSAGVQAGGEPASSEALVSFTAGPESALGWSAALWIRSLGRGSHLPLSFRPALCEVRKEETPLGPPLLREAFPSPAARRVPPPHGPRAPVVLHVCLRPRAPPWTARACSSCSVVLARTKLCSSLFPPNSAFLSVSLMSCYNLWGAPNETSSLHLPLACLASSSVTSRRALAILDPPRFPPHGGLCYWQPVP